MKKIDFIGVGVPRSATTWIGECLADHPQINFSSRFYRKEINFFTKNYNKGIDWYLSLFPNDNSKLRGEYSPTYFWSDKVAERIKKHFPNAKIIISLRNPVDMIYSLYWMGYNAIQVDRPDSFDQAVSKNQVEGLKLYRALYSERIAQYLSLFPRNNILLILFDDIEKEPEAVIKKIYQFLDVNPDYLPENLTIKINTAEKTRNNLIKEALSLVADCLNRRGLKRLRQKLLTNLSLYQLYSKINKEEAKYPPMMTRTRLNLINHYREDILKTQELIGQDLSLWLKI